MATLHSKGDREIASRRTCFAAEVISSATCYKDLLKSYGTPLWLENLKNFLESTPSLASRYAMERNLAKIPVMLKDGASIQLSPGAHSVLIKAILEEFASRFAGGSILAYIGDTGEKWAYADGETLKAFGIQLESHGKMPDVILYDAKKRLDFLN